MWCHTEPVPCKWCCSQSNEWDKTSDKLSWNYRCWMVNANNNRRWKKKWCIKVTNKIIIASYIHGILCRKTVWHPSDLSVHPNTTAVQTKKENEVNSKRKTHNMKQYKKWRIQSENKQMIWKWLSVFVHCMFRIWQPIPIAAVHKNHGPKSTNHFSRECFYFLYLCWCALAVDASAFVITNSLRYYCAIMIMCKPLFFPVRLPYTIQLSTRKKRWYQIVAAVVNQMCSNCECDFSNSLFQKILLASSSNGPKCHLQLQSIFYFLWYPLVYRTGCGDSGPLRIIVLITSSKSHVSLFYRRIHTHTHECTHLPSLIRNEGYF